MSAEFLAKDNSFKGIVKRVLPLLAPYLGLIFVIILFSIWTKGQLLSASNLKIVFNQFFPTLLCAVGATFYWAHGALDISISSAMGCAAILAGTFINQGSFVLGLIGAIVVAMAFGLVNGLLSTVFGLPAFLATVCTLFIGNGIQSFFTLKEVIYIGPDTDGIDSLPVKIIVAVLVIVVCYIIFEYTRIGKDNIIIGGNIKAAKFSGIKVNKQRIIAFLIAGVLVGAAAFFNVCRLRSVTSTFGAGMQFNVMISMVFGGMIVGGGKNAKISKGVVGAITYTLVANGLQIAGVPTEYVSLIKGIIFIVVIAITFRKMRSDVLPS